MKAGTDILTEFYFSTILKKRGGESKEWQQCEIVSLLIIKSEKINLTHIKHVTVTLSKYYGTLVLILNFFNVLKVIGEVYKKLMCHWICRVQGQILAS